MYLLGYDVGSSSVKASIIEVSTGRCVASDFYPKSEAPIKAVKPGWAEQNPADWWHYLTEATKSVLGCAKAQEKNFCIKDVRGIGISWQMHGLVCIDRDKNVLRDAIIWCDSRAVPYGERALRELGSAYCLGHLLNSPGNFTASKLAWVKENEPEIYNRIWKIMLPGDYIAMKLCGEVTTTIEGLSEGMMWDFEEKSVARTLLNHFGFEHSFIPELVPNFGMQGALSAEAAAELGLAEGTPITYRGGDQPNNALSLGVLNPGEIASTAGTSGVVYGVGGSINYDPQSRVNTFAHVNYTPELTRLGVLLCINGTGILNSWLKHNVVPEGISYAEMNDIAATVPIGSGGISMLPFGNGAERMLGNKEVGSCICGLNFNSATRANLLRAAQEGIVFSFKFGIDIMESIGVEVRKIHAGHANMFLSPIFRDTLAGVTGADIVLLDSDGAAGAARGAGIGARIYKDPAEAFSTLKQIAVIHPDAKNADAYQEAYARWLKCLKANI